LLPIAEALPLASYPQSINNLKYDNMADRGEQPYDPYIPQGGNAAGSAARDGNTRTAALQQVGAIPFVVMAGLQSCCVLDS